jgi:ribonuclease T2
MIPVPNFSIYFSTVINFAERLKVPADLTSPNTIEVQNVQLVPGAIRVGANVKGKVALKIDELNLN